VRECAFSISASAIILAVSDFGGGFIGKVKCARSPLVFRWNDCSEGETFQPWGASNFKLPFESAREATISIFARCDVSGANRTMSEGKSSETGGITSMRRLTSLFAEFVVIWTGSSGMTSVWPLISKTYSTGKGD